jgi:hypothetical protein
MKILASILCFLTWGTLLHAQSDTIAEHYKTRHIDAAIFHAGQEIKGISDKYQPNRFTPTHDQINLMEKILKGNRTQLDSLNSRFPLVARHLSKYKRQYLGYTNTKGHKIIYMNCFRVYKEDRSDFDYWRKKWIIVCDGGEDYWQACFDLNTGKFYLVSINGYA